MSERSGDRAEGLTRRMALGAAVSTAVALDLGVAVAAPRAPSPDPAAMDSGRRKLGSGGRPMGLAAVAAVAKRVGNGEPVALVDLAALDHNCRVLNRWSRAHGVAWRPAYKTLRAPGLLGYVVGTLDRPRVMIHHLRDLPQALPHLPAGADFLMGYPPTIGELEHYLDARPPRRGRYTLRINVDDLDLLRALVRLSRRTRHELPLDIAFEIYNGIPRGGLDPAGDLSAALKLLRTARRRLRLGALLCYDALAAGVSDPDVGVTAARFAQEQLERAAAVVADQAGDLVDRRRLIRNGPGSANYLNWADSRAANEFSAGSAVLFADYLDSYQHAGLFKKALYLCAPVLHLPRNLVLSGPDGFPVPDGSEIVFIKAGGWPTGLSPKLSRLVHPPGLDEMPVYGRGANSSGMISAPAGALKLGDYVVETAQQVMEGQDHFGGLHAVREGEVLARWPVVTRWGGAR